MKKALFTFLVVAFTSVNAQTYSISPAKTVTFNAPFNNVTINDIKMVNTGTANLSITWELVSMNLPNGWDYSMCDLGNCHSGIPAGPTTMNTSTVGGSDAFLGLNINPYALAGTGTVVCRVYRTGFPSNADTVKWKISAGTVGMEELNAFSPIKIYPNPVAGRLNIVLSNSEINTINVTDALGRIVLSQKVSTGNSIDLSNLEKGFYTINISTPEKTFFKRIVKE